MLPYWMGVDKSTNNRVTKLGIRTTLQQPPLVVQNVAWILLINLLCVPVCRMENNKEYLSGEKVASVG